MTRQRRRHCNLLGSGLLHLASSTCFCWRRASGCVLLCVRSETQAAVVATILQVEKRRAERSPSTSPPEEQQQPEPRGKLSSASLSAPPIYQVPPPAYVVLCFFGVHPCGNMQEAVPVHDDGL